MTSVTALPEGIALPPGITAENGKLRWGYEVSLWRRPVLLYPAAKGIGLTLIIGGLIFGTGTAAVHGLAEAARYLLLGYPLMAAAMLVIFGLSYFILCLVYRGRYAMLFEMDEAGVLHAQVPRQRQTAVKLALGSALVSLANKNYGLAATGLATANSSFYSRFADVKKVQAVRRHNLIRVNGLFMRNQIYASDAQYDFVWQYITSRCPQVKTDG